MIPQRQRRLAADHAGKHVRHPNGERQDSGKGTILIEPKPREPTKHQYDYDCATCINFLRAHGLEDHVKMNIETNHATLAGHEMQHELEYAGMQGFLGSIDANTGDTLLGWDTDQFPNNHVQLVPAMLELIRSGGYTTGGTNFDAKVRRQSIDPIDQLEGHIGGMDVCAQALLVAEKMIKDGRLKAAVDQRYAGWDGEPGQAILQGRRSLSELADEVLERNTDTAPVSGRQEVLENLFNRFCA